MLIRFIAKNFGSLKHETEFNMLTGTFKRNSHHIYNAEGFQLLKAAAMYGANGSGKTTFIRAIWYLKLLVMGFKKGKLKPPPKFKLDKAFENKETVFEIEFIVKGKHYHYGISTNHDAIEVEWLFQLPKGAKPEMIFERKKVSSSKCVVKFHPKYSKNKNVLKRLKFLVEELIKPNLPIVRELRFGELIKEIADLVFWFKEKLIIISPDAQFQGLVRKINEDSGFKKFASSVVRTLNTGITSLELDTVSLDQYFGENDEKLKKDVVQTLMSQKKDCVLLGDDIDHHNEVIAVLEKGKPIAKRLVAYHSGLHGEKIKFDLDEESDGTLRLLDFMPAFYLLLKEDVTIFIDEIERSLHSEMSRHFVSKFLQGKSTKGQLIFTTHETHLLDLEIFRQDEIWFAEKDNEGTTTIYSMSEFSPRFDLDIRKGYLAGRFGAIPFLGNFDDLNWTTYAKKRSSL